MHHAGSGTWRMIRSILAAAALLLAATAAHAQAPTVVRGADPQMDSAIARAQATVRTFIDLLQRPGSSRSFAAVKVRFATDSTAEDIWLDDTAFNGRFITGTLNDDATTVSNVKQGDAVSVRPEEISDWMVVDGGRICGGFTERVNASRRTAEEQEAWMHAYSAERMPPGAAVCDAPAASP
jgi:uncharacterized protein YegJ (DUF2314 family)